MSFVGKSFKACAALGLALWASSSSASAQIVYEPVQHQYSAGGQTYYYGGADPRVHAAARRESGVSSWGRTNGYAFHSGRLDTHRAVVTEPTRVYTDQVPYWNARVHGFTPDDARNEAYANSYAYFRKADLLRTAVRQADGTWHVPAQPSPGRGSIEIRPVVPAVRPMLDQKKPAATPKPVLIIPKRLLDKPLWGEGLPQA